MKGTAEGAEITEPEARGMRNHESGKQESRKAGKQESRRTTPRQSVHCYYSGDIATTLRPSSLLAP